MIEAAQGADQLGRTSAVSLNSQARKVNEYERSSLVFLQISSFTCRGFDSRHLREGGRPARQLLPGAARSEPRVFVPVARFPPAVSSCSRATLFRQVGAPRVDDESRQKPLDQDSMR